MFECLIPDMYVKSISDIDINKLKSMGFSAVISDLDNTLDSHETSVPSPEVIEFLDSLKNNGLSVCIISNGKHERVKKYLENLDIPYVAKAGKPLKSGYLKALEFLKCETKDAVFIGDQIFTDVFGAKRVGITSVLVDPIEQFENPFFYIKRTLEKFVKAKIPKE